jgi:peptidoglycan-associated lipoprotein
MPFKLLSVLSALLLLAACSSDPEQGAEQTGGGQVAQSGRTDTSASVKPGSVQDFVVNVGDRVFFDFDRSDLKPDALATLDKQAEWLMKYSTVAILIEGHCDERGTREYNLALGDRRAASVRDYLVSKGIAKSRLKTISYGKERPAVLGSNEDAWAQNRRGVTTITGGAAS